MDFETLYRLTNKKPKDKAENGNILGIKPRKNLKRFSFIVRCLEWYSDPRGHIASVIFPDIDLKTRDTGFRVPKREEVLLKCACPAFLYYGSAFYASQFMYHIDGNVENRPPVIRDPDSNRYLCKHLIRVYKYLEKISFVRLFQRFKLANRWEEIPTASIDNDIIPILRETLPRLGVTPFETNKVINSLTYDNCEDILERYGVIVSENPTLYK